MIYLYQKQKEYFAAVSGGMEELAAEELKELGARNIRPEFRGIRFSGEKADLYRVNYHSRLLSRIMAPLASFKAASADELHRNAMKIPWADFLSTDHTFAVFANVSESKINHSHFAALRLKDAIADSFMASCGKRPDVDARDPDVWFNLHIRKDRATVSIDTSGGPLHRRGYRKESIEAPMQETLAAAIIRISQWDGSRPLVDPMCGSGTLLSEALMHHCRIPAAYLRDMFGFQYLPDFDPEIWQSILDRSKKAIRTLPENLIAGSDITRRAIGAAKRNTGTLTHGGGIRLTTRDYRKIEKIENAVIVCNPPYGIRLGEGEDMSPFYKELGDFLKQRCTGCTAYIYFGDRTMIKKIGLKAAWKKPLKNGGLDGRLVRLDLY